MFSPSDSSLARTTACWLLAPPNPAACKGFGASSTLGKPILATKVRPRSGLIPIGGLEVRGLVRELTCLLRVKIHSRGHSNLVHAYFGSMTRFRSLGGVLLLETGRNQPVREGQRNTKRVRGPSTSGARGWETFGRIAPQIAFGAYGVLRTRFPELSCRRSALRTVMRALSMILTDSASPRQTRTNGICANPTSSREASSRVAPRRPASEQGVKSRQRAQMLEIVESNDNADSEKPNVRTLPKHPKKAGPSCHFFATRRPIAKSHRSLPRPSFSPLLFLMLPRRYNCSVFCPSYLHSPSPGFISLARHLSGWKQLMQMDVVESLFIVAGRICVST
ncbi:hypothetical protein C8R47DRAFT_1289631 [Mycena vitilis]|nr:hypothetical protein C8R47DRAFT_1289631 [Mycena vitilis]